AQLQRDGEETARLLGVNLAKPIRLAFRRRARPRRRQVERLPARHSRKTDRRGDDRYRVRAPRRERLAPRPRREDLEAEGLERVPGEERGRLTEDDVARRLPTAERVVVHAGEVVVNERIGVDQLQRRGRLGKLAPRRNLAFPARLGRR